MTTASVIYVDAPGEEALPQGPQGELVALQAVVAAAEEGIEKALLAELTLRLAMPIAQENARFNKPKNGPWAAAFFMPEAITIATLGAGGYDNHVGLFQIDLNFKVLSGTADATVAISELRQSFRVGRILEYGATKVRVTRIQGPRSREVDGYYRRTLTVYWESQIQRPS